MSRFNVLVLGLLALFVLSACSQTSDSLVDPLGEGQLYPQPNGLAQQETSLTEWLATDGYSVEIKATGLGAEGATVPACDCAEATLSISNPDSVEMVYAQVVNKGRANPKTDPPDDVTVSTASETKTWSGGDLTQRFVNPQGGAPLTDGGQIYEGVFDAAASITARIDGVATDGYYQPRSFVIYIFRKADATASVGKTPNYYVFHDSATETLSIPAAAIDREVEITFAVSDLKSDSRDIILSASAGSESVSSGSISLPDEDEVVVRTLTLTVPAGVSGVEATVTSPDRGGDSVYWSGVNLTFVTSTPGRFTGGGHVTDDRVKYTFGLTLHCDVELSNNLEINWGKGNKWHLEKESLTDVLCSDDPDIKQRPLELRWTP